MATSWFRCAVMLHCPVSPPGGAISNMYAMLLARFKMFPEVKEKGMSSVPRLAAFTSEHVSVVRIKNSPIFIRLTQFLGCLRSRRRFFSLLRFNMQHSSTFVGFVFVFQSHFSIKKGAAALGIGTESVICIKADERCRICRQIY